MEAELIYIVKYNYSPGSGFVSHAHKYLQLFYVVSGEARFCIENQKYTVSSSEFVLILPEQSHQMRCLGEAKMQLFDIKFTVSDPNYLKLLMDLPHIMKDEAGCIRYLLNDIRMESKEERSYFVEIISCSMDKLLYSLLRFRNKDSNRQGSFFQPDLKNFSALSTKVISYMKEHYSEEFSLKAMSDFIGYHPNYCSAQFRKETGYTISSYLNIVRISESIDCVRFTTIPLQVIAQQSGFKSLCHFSRVFKSITSCTPTQMRMAEQDDIYFDLTARPRNPYLFEER